MKLYEELPKKDIELLENKGYKIDKKKEYSKEYLKRILLDIEEDIMICSSKNNEMSKISSKYSNIINTLGKVIDM